MGAERQLPRRSGLLLPPVCKNPQVDIDRPAVAELMANVAAVARRVGAVREDVCETILREIPQLRDDKPVLALLASGVDSNVDTCLQIMQHRIDLAAVQAPTAAVEYSHRLAQRSTPLTALLRAYRVGHACFVDWLLKELAQQEGDAQMISAATLGMSRMVSGYIDQTSEEMVAAYAQEGKGDLAAIGQAYRCERRRGHSRLPAAPVPHGPGVLGGRRGEHR
jgi:hypothetical protein